MTDARYGTPCPKRVCDAIAELRLALQAHYGSDYSFRVLGNGYLLASSERGLGSVLAMQVKP